MTNIASNADTTAQPNATGTPEYSDAAWAELELRRTLMQGQRIHQLFHNIKAQHLLIDQFEKQFIAAAGNPKKARRQMLLLAIKEAGKNGLMLADARRFIPEQKDLEDARDYLMRTEDDDGNLVIPLIEEKQGKKNALRLFFIESKGVKPEPDDSTETEA